MRRLHFRLKKAQQKRADKTARFAIDYSLLNKVSNIHLLINHYTFIYRPIRIFYA